MKYSFLCNVKVLILHQHFNNPIEGGPIRSFYLAKALIDHGVQPVVITAWGGSTYRQEDLEGIEVHYLPVPYDNQYGFWHRSISFLRYAFGAVRLAGKMRDISICYAISVPLTVGISARLIKLTRNIPYIFEVGDLWPEAPIQLGFIHNYLFKRFLYTLEKSIYLGSQSVVALSVAIRSEIRKKVPDKKIHLIPNMADVDFYRPEVKDPSLEKKFGVEKKFVISYIGAVGFANGLESVIDCARECQHAGLPVHFLLCGSGAMLAAHQRMVKEYRLSNFTFIAFQNREGVREVLNVTDAVFISYRPVPILETGSPNKYFDGLASGKLIIINFGGWIKNEIESQKCGIYVDVANPSDFSNKIRPFVNSQERLMEYQRASRLLAESRYSRALLSRKFAEIFDSAPAAKVAQP